MNKLQFYLNGSPIELIRDQYVPNLEVGTSSDSTYPIDTLRCFKVDPTNQKIEVYRRLTKKDNVRCDGPGMRLLATIDTKELKLSTSLFNFVADYVCYLPSFTELKDNDVTIHNIKIQRGQILLSLTTIPKDCVTNVTYSAITYNALMTNDNVLLSARMYDNFISIPQLQKYK